MKAPRLTFICSGSENGNFWGEIDFRGTSIHAYGRDGCAVSVSAYCFVLSKERRDKSAVSSKFYHS